MNKFFKTMLTAIVLFIATLLPKVQGQTNALFNRPNYETGRIYVRIKDSSNISLPTGNLTNLMYRQVNTVFLSLYNQYNVTQVETPFVTPGIPGFEKCYAFSFTDTTHTQNLINDLQAISDVKYAERIPLNYLMSAPNDLTISGSITNDNFHLYRSKVLSTTNIPGQVNSLYDYLQTTTPQGLPAVLGIVDDALLTTHEDLVANLWNGPGGIHGHDMETGGTNPNPPFSGSPTVDPNAFSHGTHVSGIAGAVTNNGLGTASVGLNRVRLMGVKIKNNNSGGNAIQHGYPGIRWAADNGAQIIQCSWGGPYPSQMDYEVVLYAYNKGCTIVAAAGNSGVSNPAYPAAYGNGYIGEPINSQLVIAVAALDQNDNRSIWSPTGSSNFGTWVDISAYGTDIYSSVGDATNGQPINNKYLAYPGTSMAAPFVSGLLGFMYSYQAVPNREQTISCLLGSANRDIYNTTLHPNNVANTLGAGRVDALAAIRCLVPVCPNLVASVTSSSAIVCPNTPVTLHAATGATTGTVTYQWNTGAVTQNISVQPTVNTTYTATVTLSTGSGSCSTTATKQLIVPIVPSSVNVLLPDGLTSACSSLETTVSISPSIAATFSWVVNGVPWTFINSASISVGMQPGVNTFQVTANNIEGCPSLSLTSPVATFTFTPSPTDLTAQFTETSGTPDDGTVCAGSTVILNANSSIATNYTWYRNYISSATEIGNATTITQNPEYTTTYIVVATNNGLCSYFRTVTITVLPKPNITITTDAGAYLTTDPITLTSTGSVSGYTWTGPNNWTASGATATRNPVVAGTYTVVGTSSNGCTASATVIPLISTNTCLPTGTITIGSGANRPNLSNLIGNVLPSSPANGLNIFVIGTFTSGQAYTFNNCTLIFNEGASWSHNNGDVRFDNCTLKGCDKMWKGFTLSSAGTLIMNNSTISDAYRAVDYQSASISAHRIRANSTTFTNNYEGIHFDNAQSSSPAPIDELNNCTFNCIGNLLPAYTGQPQHNSRSDIGISITGSPNLVTINNITCDNLGSAVNVNSTSIVAENLAVTDCTNGISADNSHLRVQGCDFTNILNSAFSVSNNSDLSFSAAICTPLPMHNFTNCQRAVSCNQSSLNAWNCIINDGEDGFVVSNAGSRSVGINNNTINVARIGIQLSDNGASAASRYLIHNNHITIDGDISLNPRAIAISDLPSSSDYRFVTVAQNTITLNEAVTGINLNGTISIEVKNNSIYATQPTTNREGILIENSAWAHISDNIIQGDFDTDFNTAPLGFFTGIRIGGSNNARIACNLTDHLRTGVEVNNVCANTFVSTHQFGDHRTGIYYTSSASPVEHRNRGNQWLGSSYTDWAAKNDRPLSQLNFGKFFHSPNSIANAYTPPSSNPTGWFVPAQSPECDCGSTSPCGNPRYLLSSSTSAADDLAVEHSIAANELEYNVFEQSLKWQTARALDDFLTQNPDLVLGDSLFQIFSDSIQTTTIKAYNAQKEAMQAVQTPNNLVKQQLIYLQTVLDDKRSALDATEASLKDMALTTPQMVALKTQYTTLFGEYEILSKQYATIAIAYEQDAKSALAVLEAQNASLQNTEVYETNEKTVNEIYLETVGNGKREFTATQQSTLFAIAQQCPYSGGEAVYAARSLYALVDNPYYDDRALCAAQGVLWRTQKPKNTDNKDAINSLHVKAFPNPTSNLCTVFVQGEHDVLEMTVTDALGRAISTSSIAEKSNQAIVSFETMPAGLYILTLKEASGAIAHQQKLLVIK
jgi:Subtilase family/Secretion system C-terminal sorting domain/Ig-like domain CHU_C associated